MRVLVRLAGLGLLLGLLAAPGFAANAGRARPTADKPELNKVSSHLLSARELALAGTDVAEIAAEVPSARLRGGLAAVRVSLEELTPAILERLRAAGLVVDSYHLDYALVSGRLELADLDRVAAVPEVATIHPQPRRGTRTGSVPNQADATMNTDDVRTALGVDGTGVRVGILSDSFRDLSAGIIAGSGCSRAVTGTASQTSGDVPNDAGDVVVLDDGPGGGSDEGRALAELMADLAPGATYLFHSAFNSAPDFAAGITELVDCGAELIVDDVYYTLQPLFQDGPIAAAAQAAVDAGVLYFSATGNDATFGIHDVYVDADPAEDDFEPLPTGHDLHDFASGDSFAAITIPNGCTIYAELQWSEPFDGALGPGASSDLDLFLLSSPVPPASVGEANRLKKSVTFTGCGALPGEPGCADGACGDPVEVIEYTNSTGSTQTTYLAIEHFCGDENIELRVVTLSPDCSTTDPASAWNFEDGGGGENPIFVDAQIFGHPAARDVVAVGAAFYGEIDSGGTLDSPPGQLDVEPYSSLGGDLPFYFDAAGGALPLTAAARGGTRANPPAPELRQKPDLTSADGSNNSFFGIDDTFDGDAFPNFFGTSAAAPHATALAALIFELTGELISPLALHQLLEQATLDMETTGPDDLSGGGFVDAIKAASALDSSQTPSISDLVFDLDGGSFLTGPRSGLQKLQAGSKLTVGNGDYSGVSGCADQLIFTDGFESGDVSAWSNTTP